MTKVITIVLALLCLLIGVGYAANRPAPVPRFEPVNVCATDSGVQHMPCRYVHWEGEA